jgi:hypothetical protein
VRLAEDHEGNWQLIFYNEIDFRAKPDSFERQVDIIPEMKIVAFNKFEGDIKLPNFF